MSDKTIGIIIVAVMAFMAGLAVADEPEVLDILRITVGLIVGAAGVWALVMIVGMIWASATQKED